MKKIIHFLTRMNITTPQWFILDCVLWLRKPWKKIYLTGHIYLIFFNTWENFHIIKLIPCVLKKYLFLKYQGFMKYFCRTFYGLDVAVILLDPVTQQSLKCKKVHCTPLKILLCVFIFLKWCMYSQVCWSFSFAFSKLKDLWWCQQETCMAFIEA